MEHWGGCSGIKMIPVIAAVNKYVQENNLVKADYLGH